MGESDKMELVSWLLTSFVQDKFYKSTKDQLARMQLVIESVKDKEFAGKAAVYARNVHGMRSASQVIAAEIAKTVKGADWTRYFYDQVVRRPDDITEILAFYLNKYGKPLPNSLKKGLAKAFAKFNRYQLAKYRGEGHDITLVDAVNMLHPTPTTENAEALRDLMKGNLKSEDTWEAKLTQAGQVADSDEEKAALKGAAWRDLLVNEKLGYLALIRNLRNIVNQAPECVDLACKQLVNEKAICKSLIFPFQINTAIKELSGLNSKIVNALNDAMDISLKNVPVFDGETLVVLDVSGSMQSGGSTNGTPIEIGSLFAAVLAKANSSDIMLFDTSARYVHPNLRDSVTTIAAAIKANGGGTNMNVIFPAMNKKYDRIIILSDMANWVSGNVPTKEFKTYKETYKANPYIYSFDLQGYGTLQFPENKVFAIAGFSDKIFDVMKLLEQDKKALVNEIEKVTFE